MKYYKTVTLRSTSGNKINIPAEAWKKLGWKLNDKLKMSFWFDAPSDDANPVSLHIEREE
tara:strand:- start:4938 stop:5117 length:180 start_codon:yes stop_codon:yes gene_type:complete